LTAIALHADIVSMERPIHGATPSSCRERRAPQPSQRSSDDNPALGNPHAGDSPDARPPNPEGRQSACLRSAVAALRGRYDGVRERAIGPLPTAPIVGNAAVNRRVTPVRPPAALGGFRDPACCTSDVLAGFEHRSDHSTRPARQACQSDVEPLAGYTCCALETAPLSAG
jgi:hypothetical protein